MLDTYTKFSIINFTLPLSIMWLDSYVLNYAIGYSRAAPAIAGWLAISLFNIAAWLCYFVWSI